MRNLFIICLTFLSSCSVNLHVKNSTVGDQASFLVESTDDKAKAAKLIPLRMKSLNSESKEIRVWIGFGTISPEELLIISIDNNNLVSGKKILTYRLVEPIDKNEENFKFEFLESIHSYCKVIHRSNNFEACSYKKNEYFDWSKIYKKLLSLDIWSLPNESMLPESKILVLDGLSIVVELLDGKIYRNYSYGNPAFRKEVEAQKASNIMKFIMSL